MSALQPEKKKRKKRKKAKKEKEIHLRTGQLSDSDSTIHDHEESRRPCTKRFFSGLKNC